MGFDLLVCLSCKKSFKKKGTRYLSCEKCSVHYCIKDEIPVMLIKNEEQSKNSVI